MPSIAINDSTGSTVYVKAALGSGTLNDPYVTATRLESVSGSVGAVVLHSTNLAQSIVVNAFVAPSANVAYQLDAAGTVVLHKVIISRPSNQVGSVFVGPSTVTTGSGLELPPNCAPVELPIANTNLLYMVAANANDSIRWLVV